MFYRSNQKKLMSEALSSENICWTFYWVTFPLDKLGARKRISRCVNVLCFTHMVCQKRTKVQGIEHAREIPWAGAGGGAINWERQKEREAVLWISFCFRCLHMLLELVNHTGSLSYHNILTEWWYLLKFSLQPKPLGCVEL